MKTTDVLVIGGGVVGMTIALQLRQAGRDVALIDRARLGSGSTSRNAGGVRHQFYQDANIKAAMATVGFLRELQDDQGFDIGMRQVGYLLMYATEGQGARLAQGVEQQNALGVRTRMVTVDEIAELAPDVRTDGLLGGCFGPDDGYFDPPKLAEALRTLVERSGARLVENTAVTALNVVGDRLTQVQTSDGTLSADVIVNAAGAWGGPLAELHGGSLPIVPRRSQVFVMENAPALHPDLPHTFDTEARFYARRHDTEIWSGAAFKPFLDEPPVTQGLEADWTEAALLAERVGRRIPALAGRAFTRAWAGAIEVTADDNPIIGWHGPQNMYVAAGFSGHGMCVGPGLAASIAAEINGKAPEIPLDGFRVERFGHTLAGGEGLWLQERPSRFEQWAAPNDAQVAGGSR